MEPEGLIRAGVAILVLLALSCGGSNPSPTAPTTPTAPSITSPVAGLPPLDATAFRVTVMLSALQAPTSEDVRRVFARANAILFEKTGEQMRTPGT